MKLLRIILLLINFIVGLGALAGGYACLIDPVTPLGATTEMLQGSPFSTFLIPGIVLFGLFGVGNLLCAIFLLKQYNYLGYVAGLLGGSMIVWIVVQVLIIKTVVFLHVLFFTIGAMQGLIGLALLYKDGLFPWSLIKKRRL
ncbi:hypothetical protein [uncultured Sphaerochaeta sp.]|uniref:hypothetical protein n=1 Tax=uncultured Sphaerochaeta sp. TaxID=886478 RepID=UPI0029CA802E|nr:hypothetical protein [uncultured Sphaerochaeta sp.]